MENYVVALLLRRDEKPHKYREALKKIAATILDKIEGDEFREALPELYEELANI